MGCLPTATSAPPLDPIERRFRAELEETRWAQFDGLPPLKTGAHDIWSEIRETHQRGEVRCPLPIPSRCVMASMLWSEPVNSAALIQNASRNNLISPA